MLCFLMPARCYAVFGFFLLMSMSTQALETIAPEALKPGMKGYALSVFQGMVPERFEVEVVDVVPGPWTAKRTLLVKAASENAVRKIKAYGAGFSGSPVFFEGRIAGAVAYGEQFQQEHILGVTLIGDMLAELALSERAGDVSARVACGTCELLPGAMITIPVVRGDIWMGSSGTVTATVGDKVLAFGHPNQFVGEHVVLPMHRAEVNGVMAKLDFSHKIVTPTADEIGALIWDGEVAVVGRLGQKAPMLPYRIRYAEKTFNMEVVQHIEILPGVVNAVLGKVVDSMAHIDPEGLDLLVKYHIDWPDGERFDWQQRCSVKQLAGQTKTLLTTLFSGHDAVQRIDIELDEIPKGQVAKIVHVRFGPEAGKQAQSVPLYVDFLLRSGERVQRVFSVPIPSAYGAAIFPLQLMVGDALRPNVSTSPRTPQQRAAWLSSILRSDELVLLYPGERGQAFYAEAGLTRQVIRLPWRLSGTANVEIKVMHEK